MLAPPTAKHPLGSSHLGVSLSLFGSKRCQGLVGNRIEASAGALVARAAAEKWLVERFAGDDSAYVEGPSSTPRGGFKEMTENAAALSELLRAHKTPAEQRSEATRLLSVPLGVVATANMCPTVPKGVQRAKPIWGGGKLWLLMAHALLADVELPAAEDLAEIEAESDKMLYFDYVKWAQSVDGFEFIMRHLVHKRPPLILELFDTAEAMAATLIETELKSSIPFYTAILRKHLAAADSSLKGGRRMWVEQVVLEDGTTEEKAVAAKRSAAVASRLVRGDSWDLIKYVEDGMTWAEVTEAAWG